MASKHLSLLSLLLVLSSLQVHARDSQFFSKVTPNNNNNNLDERKDTQVTPQREEELPRFTQESRNGYGLYGHDEIQNPQFNEVPYGASSSSNVPVGDEFAAGREKFEFNNNDNYNWQFRESGYKGRQNNMPDNFYNNNNNNFDGSKSEEFNNNRFRDEQFMSNNNNNGYKGSSNNNNYNEFRNEEFSNNNYNGYKGSEQFNNNHNGYNSNSNNNKYMNQIEKQGMSDTRFLEHGRYYYDPSNNNPAPSREFGSTVSNRGMEYSRNQYYNGGFNNGNNDGDFDP